MLVNLTPHAVVIQCPDGSRITVATSGTVARISSQPGARVASYGPSGFDPGIPIHGPTAFGEPSGIPGPVAGTLYIVSALFAGRVYGRSDVVYPGTGPHDGCIRDARGQVEAVTRLIRA
jgi:hypothetical protein